MQNVRTVSEPVETAGPDLKAVVALVREGALDAAATEISSICRQYPESIEAHVLASQIEQRRTRFDAMLARAEQASAIDDGNLDARFRLFECLLYCGEPDRVAGELDAMEPAAGDDPALLCRIAEYRAHCTDHSGALRCYRKALKKDPDNARLLFAVASAEVAAGELAEAEQLLDRVLAINPHDHDAYRNRATLRRWTAEDNHIEAMAKRLEQGTSTPAGEVQLCYALAKECEDVGEDSKAFDYLKRGADRRRSLLSYRVEGDLEVLDRLQAVFDSALMSSDHPACQDRSPVFVLGLPRSGTTLVDRIISSHSEVASLGEINNFAYALMHTVGRPGSKLELIDRAAHIDFGELGQRYADGIRRYGKDTPRLIDKTPLNYLYIGLIRLALPNAKIVHVVRNPMDSCYGMYRSLFRAGYPFSYDFGDLANYYLGYRQLMDHWRTVAPDAFLDVRYEELVDDQEAVTRRILEYCDLPWEASCLEFHKNRAAVATASAAQVRRPVYRDALGRWRRYEEQLEPLARMLADAGIEVR
jgi:tetratricopeptide (TPR) repeat protein